MKRITSLMAGFLVILLAVPVVYADFNCGNGKCKSGESCCEDHRCCPAGKNIYCSSSRKCYNSISAAKDDCGDNYTICASPAEGRNQESIRDAAGMCTKEETTTKEAVAAEPKQITYTESTNENIAKMEEFAAHSNNILLAGGCIEKGLTCVLTGTPCCSPYECKGKFPNTYCQ